MTNLRESLEGPAPCHFESRRAFRRREKSRRVIERQYWKNPSGSWHPNAAQKMRTKIDDEKRQLAAPLVCSLEGFRARFLAAPEGTAALSRKTPFAVIPAKAGVQPWTPAYAGVTEWRLFITFGGPQAHGALEMTVGSSCYESC